MTHWHWLTLECPFFSAEKLATVFSTGDMGQIPTPDLLHGMGFSSAAQWLFKKPGWSRETHGKIEFHKSSRGFEYVLWEDPCYPERLRTLSHAPGILFFRGDVRLLAERCVSVVGARQPSRFGVEWIRKNIPPLAHSGIVTVSGGARGIDFEVHASTLAAGGKTVAFLPCGMDRVYPNSNEALFEEMVGRGGLLITEFSLRTSVQKRNFHQRNRLIGRSSELLIVVEAGIRSGTLLTAQRMIDENGDVGVVPGPPALQTYEGSLKLLFEGAKIIRDAQDIAWLLTDGLKNRLKNPPSSPNLEELPRVKAPLNISDVVSPILG